jgi:GNAT superfamily N-acetyltransferase
MEIRIAQLKDIEVLIPTLLELRPNLNRITVKQKLINQLDEGYQIVFIGNDKLAFAIAGFRTLNFFFSGKTLYIDDLVTNSNHKRNGYAGLLLDWIKDYVKENKYDHVSLDSGFQRKDAYRLYLNKGFEVESLHFGRKVKDL